MSKQKSIREVRNEINRARGALEFKTGEHDGAIYDLMIRALELEKENKELRKQIKEK